VLTWQQVSRLAGRFAALALNSVPLGQLKRRPGLVTGCDSPHVICKASGRGHMKHVGTPSAAKNSKHCTKHTYF
jgi:hypothetical protein